MAENDKGAEGAGTLVTDLTRAPSTVAPAGATTPPDTALQAADDTPPAANLPGWTTSTTKNLRADPRFVAYASKHKTLDEALQASIDMEEKAGKLVAIPDGKETDEERAAFYTRLGVPAKPADYKLDLDPRIGVDKKQVEEYQALAHSMHMTNDQANTFFKLANERAAKEMESFRARNDEAKAQVQSVLRKEWGDKYNEEVAILSRGVRAYGGEELIADAEATGMGNKLSFIRLLHKLGRTTLEDSVDRSRGGTGTANKDPASVLYPNQVK
jgi:hypothetical protein